jgi:hypothetical protein
LKASDRFTVPGATARIGAETLPVVNLSTNGIYVASERPPLVGQVIGLELLLDGRSFPLTGRVTWVKRPGDSVRPEVPAGFGMSLMRVELASKAAILGALKRAEDLDRRQR